MLSRKKSFLFTAAYCCMAIAAFAQPQKGSTDLFDGKTLTGWKRLAGTAEYKAENGNIVGTTVVNSGNTFLVTEKEFGDFVLELDIKVDDTTSNSGVQLRSHFNPDGHEG